MCIIVVQPKNKKISRTTLEICYANNPDGAGYMFSYNGRLFVRKGFFTFDSFYQAYKLDHIDNGTHSTFVLHFRIATHGLLDKNNCHPHRISNSLAFAHNGIFNRVKHIQAKKTKSDSIRAGIIFKQLPADWYKLKGLRLLVEDFFINNNSYGAFLDGSGEVWLTDKKNWQKNRGIFYSNSTYCDKMYFSLHEYKTPTNRDNIQKDEYNDSWDEYAATYGSSFNQ